MEKDKMEKDKIENKENNKKLIVTFRVFQAIFFGIFALGLSSVAGDLSSFAKSPISTFSITTTIFGLIGSMMTGILANKSKNW